MAFSVEKNALKLRAKCNIAREHFAATFLRKEYDLNQAYPNGNSSISFRKLVNPREYSAGITYVNDGGGLEIAPKGFDNDGTSARNTQTPADGYETTSTIGWNTDFRGISLLRGYLQPMTLEEYCTATNIDKSASRIYTQGWCVNNYAGSYKARMQCLIDKNTRKVIDEWSNYRDKIVPVITWYYTDAQNKRVSNNNIRISYWHTANKSVVCERVRQQIPFGGGQQYYYTGKNVSFDTAYYSISPPYVQSTTKARSAFALNLNGAFYCKWGSTAETPYIFLQRDDNPYYTTLSVATNTITLSSAELVYDIVDYDGLGMFNGTLPHKYILPVFNTVDDIITLFADYGVTVTTNFDEVLTPTPTPEETATVNPDPTDKEIESYPDNTTDRTPIEPAYITPSSFGRSCVYNPTTTQDFLRWICDNTVDIGNWSRLFANPVDVITGISLYNLDIPAHDTVHVSHNGETNILGVTTNIPNYSILDGYNNIVDGGTLHLTAYYGNYADFTSMTYQMYIPFAGFITLRACDVVNRTLHLYYAVDFATGAAVAFVNSDDRLIYTTPCTVAGKIPLSTSDKNSQMINNTLSVLGGLGGLLGGIASGNVGGGVGSLFSGLGGLQFQTNYANKGSVSAVNMYKLIPAFVERTRYDLFLPSNDSNYISAKYQNIAGAPSTQFDTLLNCVDAGGFVQSDVVYITSQTATETEKQQIINLIKSGIYL